MKVPFVGDENTLQRISFSFPELSYVFRRTERGGISAIKFEAARIHFLSDAFVAVAIVVA